MSAGEKAFGLLKSMMLMTERFEAINDRLKTVTNDQADLSRSLSDLAQRISDIEGYLRAATGAPFAGNPRLERK